MHIVARSRTSQHAVHSGAHSTCQTQLFGPFPLHTTEKTDVCHFYRNCVQNSCTQTSL